MFWVGFFFCLAGFVYSCSHRMMVHIPFVGKMSVDGAPHQLQDRLCARKS